MHDIDCHALHQYPQQVHVSQVDKVRNMKTSQEGKAGHLVLGTVHQHAWSKDKADALSCLTAGASICQQSAKVLHIELQCPSS